MEEKFITDIKKLVASIINNGLDKKRVNVKFLDRDGIIHTVKTVEYEYQQR
jgi:hypothetical protein